MTRRRISSILAGVIFSVLTDCGAPRPPQAANARLSEDSAFFTEQDAIQADVCVLARCEKIQEYARTLKDNREVRRYFAQWNVIEAIEGSWENPTLTFTFTDRWPTRDSGIMLKKAPLPYWQGRIFAFWLDSLAKVPLIVRQQQRSRVPPHGLLQRPTLDYRKQDDKILYEQVVNAAAKFFRSEGETKGGFQLVEEYGDLFVVEHRSFPRSLAVTVDKNTYEVRWVDSASPK